MRSVYLVSSLAVLGLLAACGPAQQRVASPARTVSYNVINPSDLSVPNAQAAEYCRPYGAFGKLTSVGNGVANYECVPVAVQAQPTR